MNQRLLQVFLILPSVCLVIWTLEGQANSGKQSLMMVNPYWSDISLNDEQSYLVNRCSSYQERIQLHLNLVAGILHDQTADMNLSAGARANRLAFIDTLTAYAQRGLFPINNKTPYTSPVFLDDVGTHCAVGYLLHASGRDDIVRKIAAENNLAYVHQLSESYAELGDWAQVHGFSVDELAWIQPQYQFSCNPEISVGEIIHVTCYGDCTGAFYADFTTIKISPGEFLTWDDTYEWNSGQNQWVNIGIPDCLCPGFYRQGFQVSTPEGDSLYTVYIEAEILGPEEITGNVAIEGEAGLCRAFVDPIGFGGTPPYTFDVYDDHGHSYQLGPLCEGYYYLLTEDALGCQVSEEIQVYTYESDCLAFSVRDVAWSNQSKDQLAVTILIDGDSSSMIQLPFIAEIKDDQGRTLAWCSNTFHQFGGEQTTFGFDLLETFSLMEAVTLQLEFNENFCEINIPQITSTHQEAVPLSFRLFPNPMQDESTLFLNGNSSSVKWRIINMYGNIVRDWAVQESNIIPILRGDLSPGQYTLQVISGSEMGMDKFVIVD